MKGKENKNVKTPWYVRYTNWLENVFKGKTLASIFILIFVLASAISYGILKTRLQTPYSEFYDIEFKKYISTELEDISKLVIDEGVGIKTDKIPETISKYNISWSEEGVEFDYVLDTEKIISKYYLETEKKPTSSYSKEEFSMNIRMTKDFSNTAKTSSIEPPPMTVEEYQKEYPKKIIMDACFNGLMFITALIAASIPILFFSIFPAFASDRWEKNMERQKHLHDKKTNS